MSDLPTANCRIVPARGYDTTPRLIVDKCPFCGKTHRHSLAMSENPPVYGKRESDCLRGEYLLVDESERK